MKDIIRLIVVLFFSDRENEETEVSVVLTVSLDLL